MESENNLVRDVDQGVAENGENRGRTVLTVVTSSELPRASDQNASIKEVLHNMIPVVNPDGKVILYVYGEMQPGKRLETEKKTESSAKEGLWTSEQLYQWNVSHLKTEESAHRAEATVSMRIDEGGIAGAAVLEGTEDGSEASAATSDGIFASLRTDEELNAHDSQAHESISIVSASEVFETQPVNVNIAENEAADVDNESTWRQQALAFRLAFECKPLYGQLTLAELTELVCKECMDLYQESVAEAVVLSCIRGMKRKLRVHYHRLGRKFQLRNCMFDCLRTILEEN